MPIVRAFPLALVLFGTMSLTLADGSTISRITAFGRVTFGADSKFGIIVLEPSSDELLVGLDFLSKFKKTLIVSPGTNTVELADDPTPPVPHTPPTVATPTSTPPNP